MKKGFTLTELLIALGVIGVLAAVLMPVVHSIIPNQNVMMAKRAFYTVQTAVSDLINDPACYPDKTQAPGSERREGFDDGYGYENCIWGNNTIPDTSQYIETEGRAGTKFQRLFIDKLGLSENDILDSKNGDCTIYFETKDGMYWILDTCRFEIRPDDATTYNGITYLSVDVNGKNKGDNCDSWDTYGGKCAEGKTPDMISFQILRDGTIKIDEPDDSWAVKAVKANADITGK